AVACAAGLVEDEVAAGARGLGAVDRLDRLLVAAGGREEARVACEHGVGVRRERERAVVLPLRARPVPVVGGAERGQDEAGHRGVLERDRGFCRPPGLGERGLERQLSPLAEREAGVGEGVADLGEARVEARGLPETRHAPPTSLGARGPFALAALESLERRGHRGRARVGRGRTGRLPREGDERHRGRESKPRDVTAAAPLARIDTGRGQRRARGLRPGPRVDERGLGQQPISAPGKRLEIAGRAGIVAEGHTDPPDAEVQALVEGHGRARAPERAPQLLAGDDPARPAYQHDEHLDGLTRDRHAPARLAELAALVVQLEHAEAPRRHARILPRPHGRRQLFLSPSLSGNGASGLSENSLASGERGPYVRRGERGTARRREEDTVGSKHLAAALVAVWLAGCGGSGGAAGPSTPLLSVAGTYEIRKTVVSDTCGGGSGMFSNPGEVRHTP